MKSSLRMRAIASKNNLYRTLAANKPSQGRSGWGFLLSTCWRSVYREEVTQWAYQRPCTAVHCTHPTRPVQLLSPRLALGRKSPGEIGPRQYLTLTPKG